MPKVITAVFLMSSLTGKLSITFQVIPSVSIMALRFIDLFDGPDFSHGYLMQSGYHPGAARLPDISMKPHRARAIPPHRLN